MIRERIRRVSRPVSGRYESVRRNADTTDPVQQVAEFLEQLLHLNGLIREDRWIVHGMNKHGTGYFEDDEVSIDALRTVQAAVVKVNLLVEGRQGGLMTLTKGLMEVE
jgi:hypothetical protein